jgi:hypothetical protein
LDFTLRGLPGSLDVTLAPNEDPEALGCRPGTTGFPVCTATLSYAGCGYLGTMGWIQLVRSTDGEAGGEEFELDPFEPLGRLPHPFSWFGLAPTLFDAPSRLSLEPMDWIAHSFLSFIAQARPRSEIRAILGFSWGFRIRDETISLEGPTSLVGAAWDGHLPLLRDDHPNWDFATGYRDR